MKLLKKAQSTLEYLGVAVVMGTVGILVFVGANKANFLDYRGDDAADGSGGTMIDDILGDTSGAQEWPESWITTTTNEEATVSGTAPTWETEGEGAEWGEQPGSLIAESAELSSGEPEVTQEELLRRGQELEDQVDLTEARRREEALQAQQEELLRQQQEAEQEQSP